MTERWKVLLSGLCLPLLLKHKFVFNTVYFFLVCFLLSISIFFLYNISVTTWINTFWIYMYGIPPSIMSNFLLQPWLLINSLENVKGKKIKKIKQTQKMLKEKLTQNRDEIMDKYGQRWTRIKRPKGFISFEQDWK